MTISGEGLEPGEDDLVALAELVARYVTHLLADPDRVPATDRRLPDAARASRALERLALGAAIARRVEAGWQLDAATALRAGASWQQIARARDLDLPVVRAEFTGWVRGQARGHRGCGIGLDPETARAAGRRLDPPGPGDSGRDLGGPGL